MTSYNQILSILKKIADDHCQINGFGYGNREVLKLEKSPDYPLLWVEPEDANAIVQEGFLHLNLKLSLYDQVLADLSNAHEVTSDLLLIMGDIIARLQLPDWAPRYMLDRPVTMAPVTAAFDARVYGWEALFSFKMPFPADWRQVPSGF